MPRIRRLLVANRGEIARRVIRAAHGLGIASVAVYAADDRDAPFVGEADQAVALGGGALTTTYLSIQAVVDAACRTGADAIHPGYGFLAEQPSLAEACDRAGLTFVGPSAEAMRSMGLKTPAKELVAAAGVPTLPSVTVSGDDTKGALASAATIGFPLLVKAMSGGGGRGMRVVSRPDDLEASVAAARREAGAAFGDPTVFVERYLRGARHVEVQVVGDEHGTIVHLFDRECSIQRRHQKVLEEAPAGLVPRRLRERMWAAAVTAALAVAYTGAGTVEFLVEEDEFFFLEMNTRLQVEHPVTEFVTGLDLVELQLLVAAGLPLPMGQADVRCHGHAVEARLCAEIPALGFLPVAGTVTHVRWPVGPGLRVDAGVEIGTVVPPTYDSLIAKLVAYGPSRDVAADRLWRAITTDLELDGVATNRDMLTAVLDSPAFRAGDTRTDFLDKHPELLSTAADDCVVRDSAVAVSLVLDAHRGGVTVTPTVPRGWRNLGERLHLDRLVRANAAREVTLRYCRDGTVAATVDGEVLNVNVLHLGADAVAAEIEGILRRYRVRVDRDRVAVSSGAGQVDFVIESRFPDVAASSTAGGCTAPLPGLVTRVLVRAGDVVAAEDVLVVMEAMKIEHVLRAQHGGVVLEVRTAEGARVDAHEILVVLDAES